MTDLIYTRRIPGLVWLRSGVDLSGGMDNSLKPIWLYGCVRRWAAGFMGCGVYVLWMPDETGRCSLRERDAEGRLVPCRRTAVQSETFTDPGCPDNPDAKPRELTLRHCEVHKP